MLTDTEAIAFGSVIDAIERERVRVDRLIRIAKKRAPHFARDLATASDALVTARRHIEYARDRVGRARCDG